MPKIKPWAAAGYEGPHVTVLAGLQNALPNTKIRHVAELGVARGGRRDDDGFDLLQQPGGGVCDCGAGILLHEADACLGIRVTDRDQLGFRRSGCGTDVVPSPGARAYDADLKPAQL